MLNNVKGILVKEDGATLVEYALVVSLIAVACIVVITALGSAIQKSFSTISTKLGAA